MTYKFIVNEVEFAAPEEVREELSEEFRGVWLQQADGPKGAELCVRQRMTELAGYRCKGFDFAVEVV